MQRPIYQLSATFKPIAQTSIPTPTACQQSHPTERLPTLAIATLVTKLPVSETWTGNAKCSQPVRFAVGAASVLVFADLQLDIVGAPTTSLILAA